MSGMKRLIVALTLGTGLVLNDAQGLSPEEIAAAIEQGTAGKTLQKKCSARGDNGMDIVAMGPIGRIMHAAREAKRKDRSFTAADVTPAMTAPLLTVTAVRDRTLEKTVQEYQTPGMPGGIDYRTWFVIKSKAPKSEEPIVLEPVGPITYDSSKTASRRVVLGGPVPGSVGPLPGSDMAASFDFAAFKAIPHKEVEILAFMTDTGEHKCKINENERKALR
jgi:hypothetical protein